MELRPRESVLEPGEFTTVTAIWHWSAPPCPFPKWPPLGGIVPRGHRTATGDKPGTQVLEGKDNQFSQPSPKDARTNCCKEDPSLAEPFSLTHLLCCNDKTYKEERFVLAHDFELWLVWTSCLWHMLFIAWTCNQRKHPFITKKPRKKGHALGDPKTPWGQTRSFHCVHRACKMASGGHWRPNSSAQHCPPPPPICLQT